MQGSTEIDCGRLNDSGCVNNQPDHHEVQPNTASTTLEDMTESDGIVNSIEGGRLCVYAVHYNGIKHQGATCYPTSQYVTSYRSELEGIKGAMDIINEWDISDIKQTYDNKDSERNVNTPFYSPSQMLAPEADIILACQEMKSKMESRD